jgi:hypothetical protein
LEEKTINIIAEGSEEAQIYSIMSFLVVAIFIQKKIRKK